MSNVVQHKLANERGASIILALILFLVCAMVAGVIISAASVNAERASQQVAEEQAYLDLRSAGQAVQALFNPTGESTDGSDVVMDFNNPSNPFDGNSLLQKVGKGSGLADWIIRNATSVKDTGAPINDESNPWTTSVTSVSPYGNTSNEVSVSFSMDSDYKINALLSLKEPVNNATQLKVVVKSSLDETVQEPKITWSGSDLYKVVS